MSTKTTIKRIALVAVAALGLSLVAVAPSNAASLQKITVGSVAGVQITTGTTNVAVTTLVNFNGYCDSSGAYAYTNYQTVYTALPAASRIGMPAFDARAYNDDTYSQLSSWYAPASSGMGEGQTLNDGNNTNVGGANFIHMVCNNTGRYNTYGTISFTPDVAGTYSLLIQDPTQAYTQTTWTVVVTDPTVKSITAFLNTDTTTATADASSLTYTAASNVTAKGALVVRQYSTTDTATPAVTAISQLVTVSISKGLVSKTNDYFAGAKSVTTAAAGSTAGRSEYYVFANGEIGTATLTVTVGALTSTKTITFQGVAKTLSAALTSGQPTWISPTAGSNNTTTVTVTAKDEAGNASSNTPTITATPASTAIATATVSGLVVTITGVAAGTTVVTIADSAAVAASTTYTVTVAPVTSATLPTLTFDKTEYSAGELMTITIGAAAADKSNFAAFAADPASSLALVTVKNPFTSGAVALVAGKATWTAYAPITAGPITITATSAGGSSVAATAITATATVVSDGVAQAAADAAAEATDAANAATDAANAAAEAADAATAAAQDAADAVAALSTSVAAMIDALKKQITALTNLVIKIQKKVKA